jgi:NitT/TauT family transport system substrate-binding protein
MVLFFLAACGQKPETPVRLGAIPWPGYEPFFLARSLGLLDASPWQLVEYPTTPEVIRSFQNNAIEVAALTADEFLRLAERSPDARAILVLDVSAGADAVVAGAGIKNIADLRDRRVGVEPNAVGAFMLNRALASAGLNVTNVQIVHLGNDEHLAAFEAGSVDAVVTFEPQRSRLIEAGARVLFDTTQIPGEIIDVLVTRSGIIEERPEALRGLIEAWFAAREKLLTDTLASARVVSPREGLSPEAFVKSLEGISIPSRAENEAFLSGSTPQLAAQLQKLRDLMLSAGLLKGGPVPSSLIDSRFITAP